MLGAFDESRTIDSKNYKFEDNNLFCESQNHPSATKLSTFNGIFHKTQAYLLYKTFCKTIKTYNTSIGELLHMTKKIPVNF